MVQVRSASCEEPTKIPDWVAIVVPTPALQDFDVALREAAKRGARDLQQQTPGV